MSALLIVGPKCTLAASHAALMNYDEYADGTERLTDGRPTVTLRFPPDAASVKAVNRMVIDN